MMPICRVFSLLKMDAHATGAEQLLQISHKRKQNCVSLTAILQPATWLLFYSPGANLGHRWDTETDGNNPDPAKW